MKALKDLLCWILHFCLGKKDKIRKFRVWYCVWFEDSYARWSWDHRHMDVMAESREGAIEKTKELLEIQREREAKDLGFPTCKYYNFFAHDRY